MVSSLYLSNCRQHVPVCAKMISIMVRKVFHIAKVHMSLSTIQHSVASPSLVATISLVSILQAGDWA